MKNMLKKPKHFPKREGKFNVYPNGYRVNRQVVYWFIFVLVFYYSTAALYFYFEPNLYTVCDSEQMCYNIFYGQCDQVKRITGEDYNTLCEQEFLMPGEEWGKKPPWYYDNYLFITIIIAIFCGCFNHLMYNKGWVNA